jgi:hypothetical protein
VTPGPSQRTQICTTSCSSSSLLKFAQTGARRVDQHGHIAGCAGSSTSSDGLAGCSPRQRQTPHFTARLSTGMVSHNRDGLVRRRTRFGRRQVVDADVRIYVQEVRAVHTAASDGGMRTAVRLPGMRGACPACPPDRTRLPHHVGRCASGRRKVRIARPGKIARSRMQLLRRPGFQDGETCQGESVPASLTDHASRDPANFPQADPILLNAPSDAAWLLDQTRRNRLKHAQDLRLLR